MFSRILQDQLSDVCALYPKFEALKVPLCLARRLSKRENELLRVRLTSEILFRDFRHHNGRGEICFDTELIHLTTTV